MACVTSIGVGERATLAEQASEAQVSGPQSARREAGPLTDKGLTRKMELLAAARRVFEREGYYDTRVADIGREAGASHGTFYTYFDSKEAVFREVAQHVIGEVLQGLHTDEVPDDPIDRIRAALKRFTDAYRPAARMIAIIEEVAAATPEIRDLRRSMREDFLQRTVRGIKRWQEDGTADPDLNADLVAEALGSMVDQVCYVRWNLGKDFDEEALLDTLTTVWARAIGVQESHRRRLHRSA